MTKYPLVLWISLILVCKNQTVASHIDKMSQKALLFLGLPGCGKSTQARLLSESLKIPRIAIGDLAREEIKRESFLGQQLAHYLNHGNMPPWIVLNDIFTQQIQGISACTMIIDSLPRTIEHALHMDTLFKKASIAIKNVFYLEVPRDELENRLTQRYSCLACGAIYAHMEVKRQTVCPNCHGTVFQVRKDDQKEILTHRLNVYQKDLPPLITYYGEKKNLCVIDGAQPIEKITQDICDRFFNTPFTST